MTRPARQLGFLLLAPLLVLACRRKHEPAAPIPAPEATSRFGSLEDPYHSTNLPAACDEYRLKLLSCMEHELFPKAWRAGERLALQQMLAGIREEQRQHPDSGRVAVETVENCRDAISAMKDSGKETCPGVF